LAKYARKHGEIMRVRSGPFTQYFLNSDKAVKELLDNKSAFTSERPRWISSNEQMTGGWNVLLLKGSDPRWRNQRKIVHSHITSISRADAGVPYVEYETAKFLHQVVQQPEASLTGWQLYKLILRYNYSTFATQTFGMDIPDTDNPVIADIHETGVAMILGLLPGSYMVDIFPILDKLPLLLKPWERRSRSRFQRDLRWCKEKLQRIRAAKANGSAPDAMLPRINDDPKAKEILESMDEGAFLSLMVLIGAADTSALSSWIFLEAMLLYPEVQEKARREIVAVVGERLPVYEDVKDIPYVRCLMKEVWRWRPPVSIGHPHVNTTELTYGKYRIPKGSVLQINAYAIGHDPARHENPEEFMPERFDGDTTTSMQSINIADVTKRDHFAFGAGRRVCPGYNVAERSLAVAIMRLLWAFQIEPVQGTQLPLRCSNFEGGDGIPGVPDKRLPVTLRVLPGRKAIIEDHMRVLDASRAQFVSREHCFLRMLG
jgi:cytochrome P450